MLRKVSWGDGGFDRQRSEAVIIVAYAIYNVVSSFSESARRVSRLIRELEEERRTLRCPW